MSAEASGVPQSSADNLISPLSWASALLWSVSLSMIFYYHLFIGEVWTIRNETTYPIHGKYPLNQVRNLQLVLTDARLLVLTRVRLLVFAGQSYNFFSFCSNINWKKKKPEVRFYRTSGRMFLPFWVLADSNNYFLCVRSNIQRRSKGLEPLA